MDWRISGGVKWWMGGLVGLRPHPTLRSKVEGQIKMAKILMTKTKLLKWLP